MFIQYYTYDAAAHCVDCTRDRHKAGGFGARQGSPLTGYTDLAGIPYDAVDRDGNLLHPAAATDEGPVDENGKEAGIWCDDCGVCIREPAA